MYKFLFICIIVISLLPRGIEIINHNYLFGYDQGVFYSAVKNIVVDHKLTLIGTEVGGVGGFFQGPLWYYLLAIPFTLTGGDPYGGMVLMLGISVASVLFTLLFTRRMFDAKTALLAGFFVAISPEVIRQARFIWAPFPVTLITIFFLHFLFKVLQKKEKFLPLLTFSIGLMSHFEIASSGILSLQFLLFILPVLILRRLVSGRILLLSFLSFLVTFTPLVLFDLKHGFLNAKGVISLLSGKTQSINMPFEWIISNHFDVFRANFYATFVQSSVLWPAIIVVLILGTILFLRDGKRLWPQKAFVAYLAASPITFFLILMLYKQGAWGWWILPLHIFYCFLLGILFGQFWKSPILKLPVVAALLIFSISYAQFTIDSYKNDFYDVGGVHKIKGKLEAIDYIYEDGKGDKFGLLVFTPPIYTYAYDYLLWWHGQRRYVYLPHKERNGTFYLLVEPDFSQPWRHIGWLETAIGTGKTLEKKELPTGFIIEKRVE